MLVTIKGEVLSFRHGNNLIDINFCSTYPYCCNCCAKLLTGSEQNLKKIQKETSPTTPSDTLGVGGRKPEVESNITRRCLIKATLDSFRITRTKSHVLCCKQPHFC